MSATVLDVTDSSFAQDVEKSDLPVLVDFWAPWCGPCRMVGPVVESLSQEFAGKVKFVKVNVDDNPDIAQKFDISGIPALLFFKGGQKIDSIVGAVPKANLQNMINKHVSA